MAMRSTPDSSSKNRASSAKLTKTSPSMALSNSLLSSAVKTGKNNTSQINSNKGSAFKSPGKVANSSNNLQYSSSKDKWTENVKSDVRRMQKSLAASDMRDIFEEYRSRENQTKIEIDKIQVKNMIEFKEYMKSRFNIDAERYSDIQLVSHLMQHFFMVEIDKVKNDDKITYLCQKIKDLQDKTMELQSAYDNSRNLIKELNHEISSYYDKAHEERIQFNKLQVSNRELQDEYVSMLLLLNNYKNNYKLYPHDPDSFLTLIESISRKDFNQVFLTDYQKLNMESELRELREEVKNLEEDRNHYKKMATNLIHEKNFSEKGMKQGLLNMLMSTGKTSASDKKSPAKRLGTNFSPAKVGVFNSNSSGSKNGSVSKRELDRMDEIANALREENDQLRAEIGKLQSGLESKIIENFKVSEFEAGDEYKLLMKQLKLIKDQSLSNEIAITLVGILENIKFHYNQLKKTHLTLMEAKKVELAAEEHHKLIQNLKLSLENTSRLRSSSSHSPLRPPVTNLVTESPVRFHPVITTVSSVRSFSPVLGPTWITHQKFPL